MKKLIIFSCIILCGVLLVNSRVSTAKLNNINVSTGGDSMQVCPVTGEEFPEGSGVKHKYLNREVTFCCNACIKAFDKEPAKYLKDGLYCPICEEDDGKKDISTTLDGTKYYFCSNGCKTKFEKEPQKYLENYK